MLDFGPGGMPLPNIGEHRPLRRRHSGKGPAVPVGYPSIPVVRSLNCASSPVADGALGAYQIDETLEAKGAIHEHRGGSIDGDSDLRIWFCAESVGYATK